MARLTKAQRTVSAANREYLDAFQQWEGTEKDSHADTECGHNLRAAVPGLRRTAFAAWDRLVKASDLVTPDERTVFAWALLHDAYAPSRMHDA